MNKSIYDEAIKVITYLQCQSTHLKGNRVTIYFPKKDIETLENLLIHSQKQEKLLQLYKGLITVKDDLFDYCEIVDNEFYDIRKIETDLEERIGELENEEDN